MAVRDEGGTREDGRSERYEITALEIVWRSVWVRAVVYVALALFLATALWRLRSGYAFAVQVGVIGFVIAYILNPIVEALQRIRVRRSLAVVVVYILLLQLLVLGSLLVSQVVVETSRFINLIPTAFDNISRLAGRITEWLAGLLERLPGFLSDRLGIDTTNDEVLRQIQVQLANLLASGAESFNSALQRLISEGPNIIFTGATNIISTTLQVFLILLASAYFLYDFPRFTGNFYRFVPVRWRSLYRDITRKTDRAVGGYLRGQLLITTVLGLLIWMGLSIIGVPLALAISFLAAIFNLVPYLGPIIGVIPAVVLGFTVSPLTALLAVGVFIIANQLEGNLLSPLILSRSVNLHPVTVLLAIMIGLGLLGFVGALLAVPTVALGKVVLEDYLLTRPPYRAPEESPAEDAGGGPGGASEEAAG